MKCKQKAPPLAGEGSSRLADGGEWKTRWENYNKKHSLQDFTASQGRMKKFTPITFVTVIVPCIYYFTSTFLPPTM